MTINVGDQLLGGKVIVASIDTNDLITSVTIPSLTDETGNPLTLTFTPAQTVAGVEAILAGIV